jgi:hypothetical protein
MKRVTTVSHATDAGTIKVTVETVTKGSLANFEVDRAHTGVVDDAMRSVAEATYLGGPLSCVKVKAGR